MLILCGISAHLALVSGISQFLCTPEEQRIALANSQATRLAIDLLERSRLYRNSHEIRQALSPCDTTASLLVNDPTKAHRLKNCTVTVCTADLPPGALVRLWPASLPKDCESAIYLTAPMEHFRQSAGRLTSSQLLLLGSWLCGQYRPRPDLTSGFIGAPPLCSAESIQHYLAMHPLLRCRKKAQSAAACLINNLASPAEAALLLLLTCPARLGGYGLPKPKANPSIALNESARQLLPAQKTVKPDLFWPKAALDVEYDSDEYHSRSLNTHDRQRIAALMAMDIEVLPITRQTLYSESALKRVAEIISRKLGVPLQTPVESKQAELRQTVLGPHDFW